MGNSRNSRNSFLKLPHLHSTNSSITIDTGVVARGISEQPVVRLGFWSSFAHLPQGERLQGRQYEGHQPPGQSAPYVKPDSKGIFLQCRPMRVKRLSARFSRVPPRYA